MQESDIPYDFDKLEKTRKSITTKLEEARKSESSDKTIRDLQKRAVMQLQQFYKLLLSDYSPKDVKQMKLFLRHGGFPDLREALRMKPAKISEKLKPPLLKLDCEPARKKQLQVALERIEETVAELDREIFNYSSFSKKEQRMFERLEEIDGKIENILYLRKKIADLTDELQAYRQKIPKPEGFLDIETVAGARQEEKKRELLRAMDEAKSSLRSAIVEETEAMEKLKSFLHSSGSLLDPVVRVMPRIREMTSSVVKSGSRELTEWDVDVAISRLDKFTAELADDDPLSLIGNDLIRSALNYIHNNSEALTDYNKVLKARERKQALEDEITRLRELTITFEATESIRKEKESVRQEAGKNLEIFVQIRQELEKSVEELRAELTELGSGDGGTGSATLEDEVNKILSRL